MRNTFKKLISVLIFSVLLSGTALSAQVTNNQLVDTFRDWEMLMRSDVEYRLNVID